MVTQENAPASVPKELVDIIITQFYRVYNDLGYGFLEKVYKNAMLKCRWTTWFTKYGGPTALKWSNGT